MVGARLRGLRGVWMAGTVLCSEPTSSALFSTLALSSTSSCSPPLACPYNLRYKRAKTTAKVPWIQ
ncbi:hypothetical protein SETIT_4G037200v2 [Setaria italica]|uniref:Uncharacterized protein n=1 Tax=Setaria italica TaxID=4555 RepID=A0A368QQQ1_SETIT|nr:hypothetical protein SETIT_4G037200v2 [Setaria italica]